jgi:hypothetical protein
MAKIVEVNDALALRPHPVADLFPPLEGEALAALTEDIKLHGLRSAIVLHEGAILDGRNRLAACLASGIQPRFVAWTKKGSPTTWVLSMNLHRRHLDEAQRAMIAARVKVLLGEEARQRQLDLAGTRKNKRRDLTANWRQGRDLTTAEKAAAKLNVSPRMVERAARVIRDGDPGLIAAVDRGEVAVSAAAEVARLPKSRQRQHVKAGNVADVAQHLRSLGRMKPIDKYALVDRLKSKKRKVSTDVGALFEVLYTLRSVRSAWGFLVAKWDGEQCDDERNDMLAATRTARERKLTTRLDELTRDFEEMAAAFEEPKAG